MGVVEIMALVVPAIGGTVWIVTAVYSVRDELRQIRADMREEVGELREAFHAHINDREVHIHQVSTQGHRRYDSL